MRNQHFYVADFWHSKNGDVYSFLEVGGMSKKVYGLYTHENVHIYGWPLRTINLLKGEFIPIVV